MADYCNAPGVYLLADRLKVQLYAVPYLRADSFVPSGVEWGASHIWRGRIRISNSSRSRKAGLAFLESEACNVPFADSALNTGTRIHACITTRETRYLQASSVTVPIFHCPPDSYAVVQSVDRKNTTIVCDLSGFRTRLCGGYEVVADTGIDIATIQPTRLDPILRFFERDIHLAPSRLFHAYYFRDQEQMRTLTMDTGQGFSYKDRYIGVAYAQDDLSTEVHEISHLLLYAETVPVFLFREGLPIVLAERYSRGDAAREYRCHRIARNSLKMYSEPLRTCMDPTSERIPSGKLPSGYYFICGSFLAWLASEQGLADTLEMRHTICTDRSFEANIEEFHARTSLTFCEAERMWQTWIATR